MYKKIQWDFRKMSSKSLKRYNFRGGPKTHGQSDRHRAPGSIGAGTTPGRVIKGMRMAGRMGGDKVTVKNLDVLMIDPEKNILLEKDKVLYLQHYIQLKLNRQ